MESLDNLFDILRKERRRYVLYYLEAHDRPVPVDELVMEVASWASETDIPPIPKETYEHAEIKLTHTDLPKLAEEPYIHYNRETGHIELTQPRPAYDAILSIAEVIDNPPIERTEFDEE